MNGVLNRGTRLRVSILVGVSGIALACSAAAKASSPDAATAVAGATSAPLAAPAIAPIRPVLLNGAVLAAAQLVGPGGIIPPVIEDALGATADRRAADASIRRKWEELGRSPGDPSIEGESGLIAVGDGFYREYAKHKDRIYYRPGSSPLFVYGAIGDRYIQVGGPAGWLGWPTAEEKDFPDGGRAVSFQNGGIYYWPDTGAIDVGNVVVRYSGLYAWGETDNDSGSAFDLTGAIRDGDEPYFVFSVLGGNSPTPTVVKTQVYAKVRPKNPRPDNVELYRGPALGVGITGVLFEQDFGDDNKMRELVREGTQSAHVAGLEALTAAGPYGVAAAAVLAVAWKAYGEDVKKFLEDTFANENDKLQTQAVFIRPKQMILLSREQRKDHHGISWHLDTPLYSAQGGSWKGYFTVEEEPHAVTGPALEPKQPAAQAAQALWVTRQDLARTPWNFADANTVGWAHAERAAAELCTAKGFAGGHFTGHQDLAKGNFGLLCRGEGTIWRDLSEQEIAATKWSFTDVNQVNWAQANRAAERLCASANGGFAGGHFNGHQVNGKYGLYCYGNGSRWFDASDADLAATGFGFATPRLDDVQWAQAMRAAYGFCQGKGFAAGFLNGHQAPNKYGVVCQGSNGAKP